MNNKSKNQPPLSTATKIVAACLALITLKIIVYKSLTHSLTHPPFGGQFNHGAINNYFPTIVTRFSYSSSSFFLYSFC